MTFISSAVVLAAVATVGVSMAASASDGAVRIPEGYSRLAFADEFDTPGAVDTTRWSFERGYLRNGELQYYTPCQNAYVDKEGHLVIEARSDSAFIDGATRPVTSASLTTHGHHDWRYGYVEVRAKVPASLGTWPAIWMLPSDSRYGRWPRSGEIDIMENVGFNPDNIHFSAHTERFNHMHGTQRTKVIQRPDAVNQWHVYAVKWTPDNITWLYDDEPQYSVSRSEGDDWTAWPFDADFYLIINLAFGGGWGGERGVDVSSLPQRFEIDYVHIFE